MGRKSYRYLISAVLVLLFPGVFAASGKVVNYTVKVIGEYPHDTGAYTQGLFFHEGKLYESTGLNGKSSLRIVDLESGETLDSKSFNRKYFAEGSVILGDKIYLLTWQNRIAFTYDARTFSFDNSYTYNREGWGLTTDGVSLIASDGSSRLFFLDKELKTRRSVEVTLNGRPVKYLNELEYIGGKIWANVYTTDIILIINPGNGVVEGVVDCEGLLPDYLRTPQTDVLNGIAELDGRIFLTGKNWPRMYEVRLVESKF